MKKITITTKNSRETVWHKSEWDDYHYDGKCFIVEKDGAWVGIYNIDCVISIVVTKED